MEALAMARDLRLCGVLERLVIDSGIILRTVMREHGVRKISLAYESDGALRMVLWRKGVGNMFDALTPGDLMSVFRVLAKRKARKFTQRNRAETEVKRGALDARSASSGP